MLTGNELKIGGGNFMKKLLLVDDDRDFRKILSSALEKNFYMKQTG